MKKYLFLIKYEAKTIFRDPFNMFLCLFPMMLLFLSVILFPIIIDSMENSDIAAITTMIMLLVILTFGIFLTAAMGSFLLLEHKDEKTLNTIAVTPIGLGGYLTFKMLYVYILSALSIIIVIAGTKLLATDQYVMYGVNLLDNINIGHMITFSLVAALFAPALALFQAALAKNKVEGFAIIKLTGMTALIPILMAMDTFSGGMQYILGVFPNFWSLKAMMNILFPTDASLNLNFYAYNAIGLVYNLFILLLSYKFFIKKAQF